MQPKLLKLGSALSVAAAFLNATTAPAAAGGYDYNAALINTYIQSAPWTSYGGTHSSGWKPSSGWHYTPTSTYGSYGWAPKPGYATGYVSTPGHGTVTHYDGHGSHAYYGDPAYAKVTTIVSPTVTYDDHAYVYQDSYVDDHVLHVRKHATDLRDPVFFGFGSSSLTHAAKHELDQIGKIISAYYFGNPKVLILLSGFTDATGTLSANEALAKARNHQVKHYLMQEFGFNESRFVLRAVGEEYANMSGMPYGDNQRKVVVSLVGLPKLVTDHGHQHHAPAAAHSHDTVPAHSHETTAPTALDKGEMAAPVEEHAMAPAPVAKPMPQPVYADQVKPVTRCYVPSGPYAGTYVDGKLLATLFTDIDDYGGGKLEEVCGLSY